VAHVSVTAVGKSLLAGTLLVNSALSVLCSGTASGDVWICTLKDLGCRLRRSGAVVWRYFCFAYADNSLRASKRIDLVF